MPTFSIITICFNEVNTIEKTINSILSQTFTDYEIVVIDGGSIDGTAEYLFNMRHKFAFYVSEKDGGIYDAMNKSIKWAKGDFFYFLNAGDYFFNNNVLLNIYNIVKSNQSIDALCGKVAYKDNTGLIHELPDEYFIFNSLNDFYERNLQQQCFFYKNSLFLIENHFNTKNKICSDYEFNVDLIKNNSNFIFTNLTFCVFDNNGISSINTYIRLKEKRRIILRKSSLIEIFIYLKRGIRQRLRML